MSQIRYLLDENVSSVYRAELVKRETMLIVWKVGDPGVHLMAIEWEHKVPEIEERAGMLPRPKV